MATAPSPTTPARDLGFFERYLTLWVILCIAAGIGLGKHNDIQIGDEIETTEMVEKPRG